MAEEDDQFEFVDDYYEEDKDNIVTKNEELDDDFEIIDEDEDTHLSELSADSGVSMRTWLSQKFFLTMDKYSSISGKSSIRKSGQITPEEFMIAGDHLTENFPSWKWQSGESSMKKVYLPDDKQYLMISKVTCNPKNDITVNYDEVDNYITIGDDSNDIDDLEIDDIEDDGVYLDSYCVKTRNYDIYITYDTYYATPRVWLYGYDKNGEPLKGAEWQKDFSDEHVSQTVTYESFPHQSFSCPTIHPCRHAKTMLRMFDIMGKQSNNDIYVKYYLIIFLKFIQTMIPNIEYDFTTNVRM